MTTPIMLYTQVGTIFTFIVGLFVLYRLLIKNKDATIQLLEKQISELNERFLLQGTDILSENLEKRISIFSEEIGRLNQDKDINKELIEKRQHELTHSKEMYERLQKIIAHTSGLTYSYFCPTCDEPTIEYAEAKAEFTGDRKEYYLVKYTCGYSEVNGKKSTVCNNE